MRPRLEQQTLVTLVTGVLFYCLFAAPAHSNTNSLARELYTEGDWYHAHIEAQREMQTSRDPILETIAILASIRQSIETPKHTKNLAQWIAENPQNPDIAWVQAEQRAILNHKQRHKNLIVSLAQGVIGFYQHQIGPAIGDRCAMHPSCSRYAREAIRKYGLAGIPMTADRLIRESDHIRHRINPILQNGIERYDDPVADHSYWFRRNRK